MTGVGRREVARQFSAGKKPRTLRSGAQQCREPCNWGTACTTIGVDQCGLGGKACSGSAVAGHGNPPLASIGLAQKGYYRGLLPPPRVKDETAVSLRGVFMTRAELLEAASDRLSEAIILLTAAGEDCLAFDVEAIADRVDLSAVPVAVKKRVVGFER